MNNLPNVKVAVNGRATPMTNGSYTATSTLSGDPFRDTSPDAFKAAEAKTAFENKAFDDRKAAIDAANGYVKPKDPIYTATSTLSGDPFRDTSPDAFKAANGKYDQTSNAYKADREARQKADLQNRAFFDQQAALKAKYGDYYTEPKASYKDVTKG